MKQFAASEIKNIALLGHGSSGKTTLAEAILYSLGKTDRIGKTADGTAVMDFDADEKKRAASLSAAVYQTETAGMKLNLMDAPGQFDFAGGVSEVLTAADAAVIVLSGKSGLNVGSELNFALARENGIPCAFFVGKLDSSKAYFYRIISTLTGHYGGAICPVVVPYSEGEEVKSFVDLIHNKAYAYDGIKATEVSMPASTDLDNMRSVMLEAVASVDEELMEKYFSDEALTPDEIIRGLSAGMASGELCPVFCGINQTGAAVPLFIDMIEAIFPSAAVKQYRTADGKTVPCDAGAAPCAVVFKTVADPFVGKLSYFRTVSGKLAQDQKLINTRTGAEEKLGKVMFLKAGKQEDASEIAAGDIGCVAKLGSVRTGDTLCAPGSDIAIQTVAFPKPCLNMAVRPIAKGDEEKIAAGLGRLAEEDPTFVFTTNKETKQQILSGLGEQHLDVIATRLKNKFGVEMKLELPKVAYRETIRKKVRVQGRHKKQSGGHGQFGDVWIEFEPCEGDELIFEERVFGGAVPKNFFPAVEKGLRESVVQGVLAGYPMVGVKAILVDGSYHPVDSSEMSFKMAANLAYKAGIPQAGPVLLEPIGSLRVVAPEDNMGDIIGDINKRRGRVLGMNPLGNHQQEILAEVPEAEMGDFATAMRSVTQGRATFEFAFVRYEEAPDFVAKAVIASAGQAE